MVHGLGDVRISALFGRRKNSPRGRVFSVPPTTRYPSGIQFCYRGLALQPFFVHSRPAYRPRPHSCRLCWSL